MGDAEDRAAAVREGEIASGGQRFRYREAGTGPALLCIGAAAQLSPLRARLAERHRVIELLLSNTPASSRAIREAVATLGIAHFDLLAQGGGDALALEFALESSEVVNALVLLGPTMIARQGEAARGADEALIGRLGQLKVPSLAVFGTKDDVAPVEAGRHYRARIPGCNLVLLYDAGHAMEEERPEALAALVLDFLERRDLFLVRRESDLIFP